MPYKVEDYKALVAPLGIWPFPRGHFHGLTRIPVRVRPLGCLVTLHAPPVAGRTSRLLHYTCTLEHGASLGRVPCCSWRTAACAPTFQLS